MVPSAPMGLFRQELAWRTALSPEQAKDALAADVKPGGLLALDLHRDTRRFRGEVGAGSFRIVRRVQTRNSFTPVVEGQVAAIPGGAEVKVSLYLHRSVLFFVAAWFVVATVIAVSLVAMTRSEAPAIIYSVLLFPLIAPLIAWLGFSMEVPRTVELVQEKLPVQAPPA